MVLDPFEEIRKLQKEMNRAFERLWREAIKLPKLPKLELKEPAVDVKEEKDKVIITADIPGMDKKDIIVEVAENYVHILARKKSEVKIERKGFFQQERSFRGYERIIPLPCSVKAEEAKAEYKNGVLKIEIPKKEVKAKKAVKVKVK